jgi:hypothetical protein
VIIFGGKPQRDKGKGVGFLSHVNWRIKTYFQQLKEDDEFLDLTFASDGS